MVTELARDQARPTTARTSARLEGGPPFQLGTRAFGGVGLRAGLPPRAEGWDLPAGEVDAEDSTVETWGQADIHGLSAGPALADGSAPRLCRHTNRKTVLF